MAKGKGRSAQKVPASSKRKTKPFWRKPIVWLGSFATLVAGGVLTNILTAQTQRVLPTSSPVPTVSAPSMTPTPVPAPTRHKRRPVATEPGQPLTVVSENPIWRPGEQVGAWVFPNAFVLSASELAYLNSMRNTNQDAFAQWLYGHGAFENGTDTQLVIQNRRNYPIRIIGMDVVKQCRPVITGTIFWSGTSGVDPVARMGFDLDLPDPEAMLWSEGSSNYNQPYFGSYTISLAPGAQQVFNIVAGTSKYSCTFEFRITILDGVREVQQLIGDGAQPFRVTAVSLLGLSGNDRRPPFDDYKILYVGGLNSPSPTGNYARANPQRYSL
jgi:hypothetical protein